MSSAIEVARQVKEMRRLQRIYFRLRTPDSLEAAKCAEAAVDRLVNEVLDQQATIFDGELADEN